MHAACKKHVTARFSDITFQWKIYSGGTVLLYPLPPPPPVVFFLFSPFFLQVMLSIFSSRGSIVHLMLWKKADSYSENRFDAISQLLVDNRTPNSFWSVVIREPSTILRPKYFLQFNWWKRSSRRSDGSPILHFSAYFGLPSCCSGGAARCSAVWWNEVTSSVLRNKQDDVAVCLCHLKGEQFTCAVFFTGLLHCPRSLPSINILNN